MKCKILPIIVVILAIAGIVSYFLSLFNLLFCKISLTLLCLSVILFLICMVRGCCCAIKEQKSEGADA